MGSLIDCLHLDWICILDTLCVELHDRFKPRPEDGVQVVPIFVQDEDFLLVTKVLKLFHQLDAKEEREAVVALLGNAIHVFLHEETGEKNYVQTKE